jgi:hypothetical protein
MEALLPPGAGPDAVRNEFLRTIGQQKVVFCMEFPKRFLKKDVRAPRARRVTLADVHLA